MYTDFAAMQPARRMAWEHEAYKQFQDEFFFTDWLGEGQSAIIEHVKELSLNAAKGTSGAYLHLIADLHGGGIVGDNELEGRERRMDASFQEIIIDQLRNGVRNKGKMNDVRSIFNFRKVGKEKLGRWMAETVEEQLILTASGVSYGLNLDGSPRNTPAGQDPWTALDYAADVRPPSPGRHLRWDSATKSFLPGDTAAIDATDKVTYEFMPQLYALAQRRGLKPLRVGGEDFYVYLCAGEEEAALWIDPNFRNTVVNAGDRGRKNPLFNKGKLTMHNILMVPYRKVFTTLGAATGSKWGAAGDVNGSRSLLMGAQALAFADIKLPEWEEETFDYKNVQGIAIQKMFGILKPQFPDGVTGTTEDFGVIAIDKAI